MLVLVVLAVGLSRALDVDVTVVGGGGEGCAWLLLATWGWVAGGESGSVGLLALDCVVVVVLFPLAFGWVPVVLVVDGSEVTAVWGVV